MLIERFGKVLHKIRHQRHLSLLWLKGLIFGFIPKENAEEILRNQEVTIVRVIMHFFIYFF